MSIYRISFLLRTVYGNQNVDFRHNAACGRAPVRQRRRRESIFENLEEKKGTKSSCSDRRLRAR